MKRLVVCISVLAAIGWSGSAMAVNCYSDRIVKGWVDDRNHAEEEVVQAWARGAPPEVFASEVAVILSNELNICSMCRGQREFLKGSVHILGKGSDIKVEMVPGIILERLLGYDILSPYTQFPSRKRTEAAK